MSDLTYHQRNWDVTLDRAKDYYENEEERLREHVRDKCRNLSEEKKTKIWKKEYGKKRYRYREAKKSQYHNE